MTSLFKGKPGSAGFIRRKEALSVQEIVRYCDHPLDVAHELAKVSEIKNFSVSQEIYKEEAEADRLYFVLDGSCELEMGPTSIYKIEAGQSLGEFPLVLKNLRYTVTARVPRSATLASVTYRDFVSIADKCPSLWAGLARKLALRLQANNRKHHPQLFKSEVVFVVHGIWTFAAWQIELAKEFQQNGIAVSCCNYGNFNLGKFVLLNRWWKEAVLRRVERQLRQTIGNHSEKNLSILAHSFGSYLVSEILLRNPDIKVHRVIFCGSVVNVGHPLIEQLGTLRQIKIVNDIGGKDHWPRLAGWVRRIYGDAGTHGFRTGPVVDRVFKDFGHSDFFTKKDFYTRYWIPFFKSGTVVDSVPPSDGENAPEGLETKVRSASEGPPH